MNHLFSLGPLNIHFFGVMAAIAILTTIFLFLHESKRRGFKSEMLVDGIIYTLVGIFVGARLIYVIFYNPLYYLEHPLEIIFIHQGGLSVHGGIIGGFAVAYLFCKKNKLPLRQVLDTIAPLLALGLAIGRIGCDVFGAPMESDLPWGVNIEGTLYHPAQIYEAILNYFLFAFLWIRRNKQFYHGQIFLYFLIGYSINRSIVEFTRINPEILGPITISHLLSVIVIIGALYFMNKWKKTAPIKEHSYNNINYKTNFYSTILVTFVLIVTSTVLYYFVHTF